MVLIGWGRARPLAPKRWSFDDRSPAGLRWSTATTPLGGYDKEEITREAKRLGSYPISIIPDEDCCTLFTPKHPATKARREDVERAESALPIADMVEKVLALTERQDYEFPA